jgi:GTP cyclohydrolase I
MQEIFHRPKSASLLGDRLCENTNKEQLITLDEDKINCPKCISMMESERGNVMDEIGEGMVKDILKHIGESPDREGLKDTPKRVVRMWKEIFGGYDKSSKPHITVFNNGHDGIVVDEMINDEGSFYSNCEHHMVPFFGKYWFAYIPHPKGSILGLSKVARIVDYYSARLQIQERLTQQIVDELWTALTIQAKEGVTVIEPIGMGLVMEAEHLCKTMRGVKKKGKMKTSKLKGAIKVDPASRAEFLGWVGRNGS